MKKIEIIGRDPIYDVCEGGLFNDKALEFFGAYFKDIIEVADSLSLQQAMKLYEQKNPAVRNFNLQVSVI